MIQTTIEIKFASNPTENYVISYGIFILGLNNLVYNNGLNYLNCHYVNSSSPDEFPNKISLGATRDETIDNTLSFLNTFWSHPSIIYSRGIDSIFSTLTIEETVSVTYNPNNIISYAITVNQVGSGFAPIYLKYFFGYVNLVNDTYRCEIYTKIPTSKSVEIKGKATIAKGLVKDHLDTIRGTGLSIDLEATLDLTLEDLYTQDEQNFTVKFYKNKKIIFQGFIKPDGVYQSFVRDVWIITMDCVDGLGALENLSFVKDTGVRFTGRIKAIDIIYNCLKRTGVLLPINTSINTIYEGLVPNDNLDILSKIYLNSDRFFKVDGQNTGEGTIMSCDEVLKSVLDLFCACITQENGEWYIYRPNEIYINAYVLFRSYSVINTYIGNKTLNLNKKLGSQIDNFYPYHCNGDQKIEIKGGVSAFRLNYKYGITGGLSTNSGLTHDGNLIYDGWTIDGTNKSFLINDPLKPFGFILERNNLPGFFKIAESDGVPLLEGGTLDLKISMTFFSVGLTSIFFSVRVGGYYLKASGEWVLEDTKFEFFEFTTGNIYKTQTFIRRSSPLPIDGNVIITVFLPKLDISESLTVNSITLDYTSGQGSGTVGEFHTASRKNKVSSIIKENDIIYNGDSSSDVYIGAIYKENGIDRTDLWFRKNFVESKPILRIATEETLRIAQRPTKKFIGSFFGYQSYLSSIEINNISGKFMPIEWSYDTYTNIGTQKLLQLFSGEIPDIDYNLTFDYGETVKPTIVS